MPSPFSLRWKITSLIGINPGALLCTLREAPYFLRCARQYQALNQRPHFRIHLRHLFPILSDRRAKAGSIGGHYFHQDLWAARKIHARAPKQHIDIGSLISGFVAHLLVFMPVTVIDIRKLESKVPGLTFVCDDATRLSQFQSDSIESISTLNAAEHFGLGRYSDPIDPDSCFMFMAALERVLAPGGRLYFAVPVGIERVEFNAHRVFAPQTIMEGFAKLQLISFSYVGDDGCLYEEAEPRAAAQCDYACGLFEFTKGQPA